MKKIEAKIVADSKNKQGDRITTYLLTYPRFIHGELLTHRVFSKNSASSRAIPFRKMVKMVETDPFIPSIWQKDHKGMQGNEYLTYTEANKKDWLKARDYAVEYAENLNSGGEGVTKQLCNRLLEPFMWHTILLTGTEFKNFFELRCPEYHLENIPTVNEDLSLNSKTITLTGKSKKELLKEINQIDNDSYNGFKTIVNNYSDLDWLQINKSQAEIHIQALAEAMYDAYNESTPKELKSGKWHVPFGDKINFVGNLVENIDVNNTFWQDYNEQNRIKVATARCARLSYMTFDGEIDYKKDIKLHDTLLESQHMSPFEHCAKAMSDEEYYSFIKGEIPIIVQDNGEIVNRELYPQSYSKDLGTNFYGWSNNFKGFIQYRYLIENY